jgi:hypothetical protein
MAVYSPSAGTGTTNGLSGCSLFAMTVFIIVYLQYHNVKKVLIIQISKNIPIDSTKSQNENSDVRLRSHRPFNLLDIIETSP